MNTKKEVQAITILGRKWFDKVNGNTYNTAQILINGITVGKTPFQYGYGDHYVDLAGDWLEMNGYIKRERYSNGIRQTLWRYCADNNINLESSATYCLKREL